VHSVCGDYTELDRHRISAVDAVTGDLRVVANDGSFIPWSIATDGSVVIWTDWQKLGEQRARWGVRSLDVASGDVSTIDAGEELRQGELASAPPGRTIRTQPGSSCVR
jgi:hypothetical protein